jgi:two-component system KDP operon response regulator KdpE
MKHIGVELSGVPMNSQAQKLLIVEDDAQLRRVLRGTLKAENFRVTEADTGSTALQRLGLDDPDIVMLDLTLPDIDGLEVIRRIRVLSRVPIVVLSGRGGQKSIVDALELGADDYINKPFGNDELTARLHMALRHSFQPKDDHPTFQNGDLRVDLRHRRVTVGTREVSLSPTEFELLAYLISHAGKVLLHDQILQAVWADRRNLPYLRVYIRQLRLKIEPDPGNPRFITSELGFGYRMQVEN